MRACQPAKKSKDKPMKTKQLLVTSIFTALSSTALAAPFSVYDARSVGMGGTGVASAHISSAPFYNPAMLAAQRAEEDFSLLSGAGVSAQDNNKLIDDLEAFDAAYTNLDAGAAAAALDSASGKQLTIQGTGFLALGVAGRTWSFAASSNGYIQANIGADKDPGNALDSELVFTGIEVTETGVSIARKFGNLSIGLTPKIQDVTSYDAAAKIANNSDLGDIIDIATTTGKVEHGSTANLDIGLVYKVTENWKVGAVIRNALSEDYTTDLNKKVTLDPQTRAGIAYTGGIITFAVDYDLAKNYSIITGGEETQYLNAGIELDLLDILQLRAGMSSNTANSASEDVYSLGLGFTILAAQLDIAAVGNDNSVSAFVQLGIRW